MTSDSTPNLRLFGGEPATTVAPPSDPPECLQKLCSAFQPATGWSLAYGTDAPNNERDASIVWSTRLDSTDDQLRIEQVTGDAEPPLSRDSAILLADAVADVYGELARSRQALWHREAELAAGVPVSTNRGDTKHFAERLEAIVSGGTRAVGCQAAGLYLLDDATSSLKLRSIWQLPPERFTQSARPLRGAMADLEALCGHAVVLQDDEAFDHWNAPERDYGSALCVPVSSSTVPLGTLWMFGDEPREFTDSQVEMAEITAGALASALQTQILSDECSRFARTRKQVADFEETQCERLQAMPPLSDQWDIAGWSAAGNGLSGDFFDWLPFGERDLAVAVGDAQGRDLTAAFCANSVQTALRAHNRYELDVADLVTTVNETLYESSMGDRLASLFYAVLGADCVQYSFAGHVGAIVLSATGWQSLSDASLPLGTDPKAAYHQYARSMAAGEVLVVFTRGLRGGGKQPLSDRTFAELLLPLLGHSAEAMASEVRRFTAGRTDVEGSDRTLVVMARR